MRYYIIAGEASGDLHASNLIAALRKSDAKAEIRAWGGDLMQQQGATIVKHYRDLAFMGWAWKKNRVHTLKKLVDKMLVILPFEKAFYQNYQLDV